MVFTVGWEWHQLDRLQQDFSVVQSESFHLAEHLEEKMLTLKEALHALDIRANPAVMADFRRETTEMRLWVQTNRLSVASAQQRDVFGRIEAAFDRYANKTTSLLQAGMRAGSGGKPEPVLELVAPEASAVLFLARDLRMAEQAALNQFVKDSRRSMGNLRTYVVVSLGLGLVLGIAALRLIHIARIAPLKAELLRSQSILAQREKLASLGTFAAGVAHEVRNPLTAIKLRLHSLQRAVAGNPSADEDLFVIHNEIRRLEAIVRDFLEFARPAAPRMETFAAVVLFEQVHRLLGSQLAVAGIVWAMEAPPEVSMRADLQQIEQVLINLIQNATENTGRGGSITLRAGICQARWPSGTAAATVLDVVDTGKGIPPEVAERLFDPFFSTKKDGTGLGLSIAARIVEAHGGLLQYRTELGRGTTFSVMLPSAAERKYGS